MTLRSQAIGSLLGLLLGGSPLATAAPAPNAPEVAVEGAAEDAADEAMENEAAEEEAPGADGLEAYWDRRLDRAHKRIEIARERAETAEAEYSRARHDGHPRGTALLAIEREHAQASKELAAAEAALPRLVEQARRAGVAPGILRAYWDEDAAEEE